MARIQHYDVGDLWTPLMTWKVDSNSDGIPDANTDPSQIVIRLKEPDGTESVVTTASSPSGLTAASTPLARISQGVFRMNPGISLDAPGYWFMRAEGVGAAEASEEFQAVVDPSEFTADAGLSSRALVGLAETKDWLQQQNVDTGEDLELVRVINDASARIHYEAGREFKAADAVATRTFAVNGGGCKLKVGDLAALTTTSPAVTLVGSDWTTTIASYSPAQVSTFPLHREAWEPITSLEIAPTAGYVQLSAGMRYTVTGTWGFPAVPGDIRQATLDTIAAVVDRDVEHYRQDLASSPQLEGQNTVIVSAPRQMFITLPPAAFAVCRSYRDPLLG